MKKITFVLFLVFATCWAKRDEKLLSVFTIVNFPNDQCTGGSGDIGTCFTSSECTSKGGSADGNCAASFGVCCVFSTSTCGSTVTQNTSYITNPGYPSAYTTAGACAFSITPLSSSICQLRLDFTHFTTTINTADGTCTDTFAVSTGSGRVYPGICGTNTGEHIYLETAQATGAQTITFTVATSATFKILVRQIPCGVNYKAPNDCLQYFTGVSGNARTFNFEGQIISVNQQFSQCIRQEHGYCGISYSETSGVAPAKDAFDLGGNAAAQSGNALAKAQTSYLGIPGSTDKSYSGDLFAPLSPVAQTSSGAITTSLTPFMLQFYSRTATQDGSGYDITWVQTPCN